MHKSLGPSDPGSSFDLESPIEASYVAQARSNTTVRRSDIIDPSTPIRLEKRKNVTHAL